MELKRVKAIFTVLPETPAIYPVWESLVLEHAVSGKATHDARLAPAMRVHGLAAVLTFDATGFARFGVEVVHPASVGASAGQAESGE